MPRPAGEQLERLRRLQRIKLGIALVCLCGTAVLGAYAIFILVLESFGR